jgi:oligopeptide/dipeptide ABC transporter ATP-binding protein
VTVAPVIGRQGEAGASTTPAAGEAADRALLDVQDLVVHFRLGGGLSLRSTRGTVQAVDGISFQIRRGETLGLVGESGCGKTTAGRAIVRLLEPTAGSVKFDGVELAYGPDAKRRPISGEQLRRLRQRFQMIFQDPYSSLNPRMTIASIVAEPLDIHAIGTRAERKERVAELLETVGITARSANRFPHEFSGGQRQRVGIARALAVNPDLIVADEPISALDVSIRAQILNLLERLQAEFSLAYLVVAHDLAAVRHISDRVAVMYLGRIVETAAASDLYKSPLHPYTVALLSAVPVPDPSVQRQRRRIILRGDIPSPLNPPAGCRFHTRCWLYERLGKPDRCRTESPPLREPTAAHAVACHFAEDLAGSPEQATATGRHLESAAPGRRSRTRTTSELPTTLGNVSEGSPS